MTVTAQRHEVVRVKSDRRVSDVARCYVRDVVDSVSGRIDPTLHALFAESMPAFEVGLPARLPCFGFVKGLSVVLHKSCGSTHAPAVLWFIERYRRALKERRADESAPPTQKEITMKKCYWQTNGRRHDGGDDARKWDGCSSSYLAPYIIQNNLLQWSANI